MDSVMDMKILPGATGFQDFQASTEGRESKLYWAGASQVQTSTLTNSWATEQEIEDVKESEHMYAYTTVWLIKLLIISISQIICFHC